MPTLRFDAAEHEYIDTDTGEVRLSITGLLAADGLIDDRWYTEESCERGHQVHRLSADYDFGAIEQPDLLESPYKGWLLAHVKAMATIVPAARTLTIEEPRLHPTLRFGGRPDRTGIYYGLKGVLEIKSGMEDDSHRIQTALQAILVAPELKLPPEMVSRWILYTKQNGRFKLFEHMNRQDFLKGYELIRKYC